MLKEKEDGHSTLSIVALAISALGCGCLSFVGGLLGAIDLAIGKKEEKHVLSIFAIIISIIASFFGLRVLINHSSDNDVVVGSSNELVTNPDDYNKTTIAATESGDDATIFPVGEVYSGNGFVVEVTKVQGNEVTFSILNENEEEHNVQIAPVAVDYTMVHEGYKYMEDVVGGKKIEAKIEFDEDISHAQSVTFIFRFGDYVSSNVWYSCEGIPVTIYSNLYDEDGKYYYDADTFIYEDDVVKVAKVGMDQENVELLVINKTDEFYVYNIPEAYINEWSYSVNGVFLRYRDLPLMPYAQDHLKIKYKDFVDEKGIMVEQFGCKLKLDKIDDRADSHDTDEIVAE